jgi:Fe-S cluster assembly protein SufD
MTQLAEHRGTHVANFTRPEHHASGGPAPAWLESLRKLALARFNEVGFPSTKLEEWRYTNVAAIARTCFQPGGLNEDAAEAAAQQYSFGRQAAAELVFVNGQFSPRLSKLGKLPRGVSVTPLGDALAADEALLERNLARQAKFQDNPFVALNTGFVRDGVFIHFAAGVVLRQPIHLLFISAPTPQAPTVSHPRVLLVAGANAEAAVVESYVGSGPGIYLTNSVTEIVAGENAKVDYNKLQQESGEAYHISTTEANLARSADLISHATTLGGRLSRNDLNVSLDGEGAHATLNGLVILGGEQHCDNHTLLRHEKAHCPSHELYKYVLGGKSVGVFKGKIFVQKDAQKTDSKQTSKSLLLSDEATMNSMPALEIYADDVKCTHGSTTGPVDEEQVFYLRSRGVGLEAARHLLTYAFAADITRRIKVEPVRQRIEDFMAAQHGLPQDLRITDLGSHDERALGL